MTINLTVPDTNDTPQLKPKITVVGVGGAGGNAVNNMIRAELEGVDFVVANTDAQSLAQSGTERRIQLGATITQGLGAGSRPDVGRAAAEEAIEEILAELDGSHMAFVAAGMGGGTGTGGAPVIARAAKENGILTVGVITKPFQFEGSHRMNQAEAGIEELEQFVDTLIVIPNQNLFRIANEKTTFADAFAMADEVLYSGVRGVTDLMVMPGLINLDFADIRTVMSEMGKAMMGTGEAEGERRSLDAAEAAIANPLLDDTSMKGAKGVLINITGGMDITLFEVDEAANRIRAEVDPDAYIIVGSAFDSSLDGVMRVSVVATGIDADAQHMPMPTMLHLAEQLERHPEPSPVRAYAVAPESLEDEPGTADDDTGAGDGSALELEAETWIADEAEPEPEADAEIDTWAEAEAGDAAEAESAAEPAAPAAAAELPIEAMIAEQAAALEDDSDESMADVSELATRPVAMPSVGAEDAFIPPTPADAEEAETGDADAAAAAEAEVEAEAEAADAAEEAPEPETRRRFGGVSLFERVTGTGKAAFGKRGLVAEKPEVTENKELSDNEGESAAPPADTLAVLDDAEESGDAETALGGVDPDDRLPSSDSDEDLLDIPAFLRRQAN